MNESERVGAKGIHSTIQKKKVYMCACARFYTYGCMFVRECLRISMCVRACTLRICACANCAVRLTRNN